MRRRTFFIKGTQFSAGCLLAGGLHYNIFLPGSVPEPIRDLYQLFKDPDLEYHPFVRWWWNGNKVEAGELIRELKLLKEAGIGGVEINPIEFPTRFEGDDLGKPSLKWLSDEWIGMLRIVFEEGKSLGMTCDLIVGSGWPFGAEYLEGEERSQIVVISVKKLTGPVDYEISEFEIFKEADPAVSSPFPGRTMELLSLHLVPDPLDSMDQVVDLTGEKVNGTFRISVPGGKHALYGLVKIHGFMEVINGAPGATGPVLNHYNAEAVRKYLSKMSDTIENKTGPLSGNIRALFTDSMELEGANWSSDLMKEFIKRRGYDIFPYLPLVLFKTGAMGNITDLKYGVNISQELENMICRMRYDFEITKAELLDERFIKTFTGWCSELNVKSRAQAYGRSFFPLESSFHYDIPECESWTMNWLKHKVGEEMPEEDYRRGRAYTMINKYVSSAANLTGKHLVSCEEMTDTYTVFNTSLENLKIGGDQSAISGVTHSVFHGFNYSPPEAPYPGWIRYGAYYNEKNTWWPWFHLYNEYKARISALLQHLTMFTDIAILPPNDDMWSLIGSQMEPFPSITHIDWFTLVWEAINKNGNGCDYVSQKVIRDSQVTKGYLKYGNRKYNTLFLVHIETLDTSAARKMLEFVRSGGRIFCIETIPFKSPGWNDHEMRDREVQDVIAEIKKYSDAFVFLEKPEKDFINWYRSIQYQYDIIPYLRIDKPDPFVMQNRYRSDDGSEVLYIINSHLHNSWRSKITFSKVFSAGKFCWIWDPESGKRFRISLSRDGSLDITLGPAESRLYVFDKNRNGEEWHPVPINSPSELKIDTGWSAEFIHCRNGSAVNVRIDTLKDLKDIPEFVNFAGIVIYRNKIMIDNPAKLYINLGKVWGVSELRVNGYYCGALWYGWRIFNIGKFIRPGLNEIEITVATSMGNYMKSLTDNPIAQYWTNEKNKVQPVQSMGLIGPVTIY